MSEKMRKECLAVLREMLVQLNKGPNNSNYLFSPKYGFVPTSEVCAGSSTNEIVGITLTISPASGNTGRATLVSLTILYLQRKWYHLLSPTCELRTKVICGTRASMPPSAASCWLG